MKAGFSKTKITPPLGTRMMGVGDRDMARGCEAIHDDIFVRTLYVEFEDEEVLIMSYDFCFLGRTDADRFKGAIGRELDLRPRQILLATTHSHVGPAIGQWHSAGYREADRLYEQALEKATLQAARDAKYSARDATLWGAQGHSRLPLNRRKLEKGVAKNTPNPGAPVSDELPVCLFKDLKGEPICLLFSIATHPSILRGFEISAEFPGVACDELDEYLGTTASLFLQGMAGDSKPSTIAVDNGWLWEAGWEEAERTGQILAEETIAVLESGLKQVEPEIHTALLEMQWPLEKRDASFYENICANPEEAALQPLWAKRQLEQLEKYGALPESAPILMHGVQLGKTLRLVAIEGEPVSHYAHMTAQEYSEGITFSLGYANGEALYLVTSAMLDEGGMEPISYWEYGFPAPLAKGMESIMQQSLKILRQSGIY
jgi:hypothetical protein